MTKLNSKLPADMRNGLGAIERMLVDDPHHVHAAIVLLDCKAITTNTDTDEVEPTARIRRIEVVGSEDAPVIEQIMRRALERRTGQTVLDLGLEDEIAAAFAEMSIEFDPETGEILPAKDDD